MHEIELRNRDLNLLVVLEALLDCGGVTDASRRLGLSQSATSHALGRLRETFEDPLLVREGNAMVPTPRALALRPALERVIAEATGLFRDETAFDPARSTRSFTVAASDLLAPVVPGLVAALGAEAPGVRLALVDQVTGSATGDFATQVDLGLQPRPAGASSLRVRALGRVEFAVVVRSGHPILDALTLDAWCTASHVVVGTRRPGRGYVGEAEARRGLKRPVALKVPTFLLALHVVAETDLLFSAPRQLALPFADRLGLAVVPHPLDLPTVPVSAVWHTRHHGDTGHRWFRQLLCGVVAPYFAAPRARGRA